MPANQALSTERCLLPAAGPPGTNCGLSSEGPGWGLDDPAREPGPAAHAEAGHIAGPTGVAFGGR